jgi:predicted regulator of Ras-like GTPase activity (Roadblock/LC7/MglB family)
MIFSALLKQILERVEGAVGAMIVGLDGIAIEQELSDPTANDGRLSMIAASYATLLRNSMRTSFDAGVGSLQEMTVTSENMTLVIKLINPEYFLLISLKSTGNLGRARFELRKAQLLLEEEFAF